MANGGTYTLKVTAKDSAGATVNSTPLIRGLVTSVEQVDGKTLITVNGVKLGWEKVTSITQPPPPATTTTPPTTTAAS